MIPEWDRHKKIHNIRHRHYSDHNKVVRDEYYVNLVIFVMVVVSWFFVQWILYIDLYIYIHTRTKFVRIRYGRWMAVGWSLLFRFIQHQSFKKMFVNNNVCQRARQSIRCRRPHYRVPVPCSTTVETSTLSTVGIRASRLSSIEPTDRQKVGPYVQSYNSTAVLLP